MEQQTKTKEIAPCFDIDKFTEDTREALLVLNLHYFSKVLEENEKLKQTSYLFAWYDSRFNMYQKIVRANNESEAIKKFLFHCDESLEIIIETYTSKQYSHNKLDGFFKRLLELGFLPKSLDEYHDHFYRAVTMMDNFSKKYHKFLEENLDNAIYIFREIGSNNFTITKIDEDLIIE